ncbi:hypothetical protein ACFO3J_10130 [Streptomyces polygonati]|uniref:Uncharacterized protein n=1 Tax=Streptomyces polygonati TaxID=1617087 RepID=A0ABV8HJQ6_9ACTN
MPHFLAVAGLVLVAWTLLSLPLGVLVGRRLRHANPAALPPGCAYRGGGPGLPAADRGPASTVPGCTARPCRAAGARTCAAPERPAARSRHGFLRRR